LATHDQALDRPRTDKHRRVRAKDKAVAKDRAAAIDVAAAAVVEAVALKVASRVIRVAPLTHR
jgi:uncharacterized protein YqfA (UPF0365 family)